MIINLLVHFQNFPTVKGLGRDSIFLVHWYFCKPRTLPHTWWILKKHLLNKTQWVNLWCADKELRLWELDSFFQSLTGFLRLGLPLNLTPHCLMLQRGTVKRDRSVRQQASTRWQASTLSGFRASCGCNQNQQAHWSCFFPGSPAFPKEQDHLRNLLISYFCHAVQVTRSNDLYSSIHKATIWMCVSTQSPTTLQNALLRVPTPC